jgi:acyl-CoA synthetase (AMP-forming)/AMP-acid ligase II
MSIGRALAWHADREPDRPSVSDDVRTLTRRELDNESNRLAHAYADLGVQRDDLVTVGLPNGVDYEAELLAWVGERLVRYKVPRSLELVREPLRDDAGKVRRSALRAARLPVPPVN